VRGARTFRYQRLDHLGVDDRTTLRDLANSGQELIGIRDTLLQQVRATA
jgi:hypothetical protein